jgi:glycosyltransferase involved in cell wall biosynthesis
VNRISIVIPNYNHSALIESSVKSCYEQSLPAFEIIVIDDGSTDNSLEILTSLQKSITTLKVHSLKKNFGAIHAINHGARIAEGEILLIRSADDILDKNAIRHATEAFEKFPDTKITFGEVLFFHEDINNGTKETLALSNEVRFLSPDDLMEAWKPDFNLPDPACFVRKTAFFEQGCLQEEAKWYSTWLCFTSIALRYGLTFIPAILNSFWVNASSYGTANLRNPKIQRDVLRFLVNQVMNSDRNLRAKFIETGALKIFGEPLKDLFDEERDSLPINSHLLFKSDWPAAYLSEELPQYGIGGVITRRLQELEDRLTYLQDLPKPKIVVYGAGTQTMIFLEIWNNLNHPSISEIVVSQTNGKTEFHDLKMKQIDCVEDSQIDLFVLSSKSFEQEMSAKLDELRPSSNRISFWAKELTRLP